MHRFLLLLLATTLYSLPSSAQISVLDSFDPSQTGGICGLGVDPTTGNVWVYQCSGATIDGYSPTGVYLTSIPRPGESANDVDIEFAPEELTIDGTTVPAGTMLFINGESGAAEIHALDPATGTVLGTLVTAFGASHVVGGGYDPDREAFFLVQDRVPSGSQANRIAEVEPVTGTVLNSFQIGNDFDVNYGDLDVSPGVSHLFVVSSIESSIGEFTPTGDFVATHDLPVGVADLSGLWLDCAAQEAWVASTAGMVWRLGGVPCGADVAVESDATIRLALQPNYPNPFNPSTTFSYALPAPAHVELAIFDPKGRLVARLVDETRPAGVHEARWEARGLASGTYLARLTTGTFTTTRSVTLLK